MPLPARRSADRRLASAIVRAMPAVCEICGNPIDRRLKWPDPGSLTVDHRVPLAQGGHPSHRSNVGPAHFVCNRAKSDGRGGSEPMPRSQIW